VTTVLEFSHAEICPERNAVLEILGIPKDMTLQDRVERVYATAAELLAETAATVGVLNEISTSDFATVYRGEGRNELDSPVAEIFPKAEHLAMFAVTLGPLTVEEIRSRLNADDLALAYMLDAMASAAADQAADVAERRYGEALRARGWDTPDGAVLRYSPGYCGWDVTGQKKLFEYLQPERIGLTLTDSSLMQPLKSVSAVVIAGPREIHRFPPSYSFCDRCETKSCRERLRLLFAQ
jgi:hypothetical protein